MSYRADTLDAIAKAAYLRRDIRGGNAMSKHTPGPWRFVRGYDNSDAVITGEGYGLECVALVKSTSCPQSDGCLIAAAPELLEALEVILDEDMEDIIVAYLGGFVLPDDLRQQARAAIAKAKGEQP